MEQPVRCEFFDDEIDAMGTFDPHTQRRTANVESALLLPAAEVLPRCAEGGMAGLGEKGLSVHKLRHTAATLMYQSGKVDIRVLKDILGHEQLNTTQIYTHVVDRNIEEAVDSNPLADVSIRRTKKDESADE
jgi:integrase